MNDNIPSNEPVTQQPDIAKLAAATVIGFVILGITIFAVYQYSQKNSQKNNPSVTSNSTGKENAKNQTNQNQPPTAPLRFTVLANESWNAKSGNIYPYTFSYPASLPLVVFINDLTDSVAISWGNIPAQQNVLLNIELIEKRDPKYVDMAKIEYVKNWYKFFSGLKGVSKLEPFTNTNGMKGYKVWYINSADASPNLDVFFEVPKYNNIMIHMANGIIDPPVFDRMVDTVRWAVPTIPVSPTTAKNK
jgi:hypothetical protein